MANELVSLGILFLCAIIGGMIATRLKQPTVFGLLLVGALIGPSALNIVQDMNMIKMMAEFGAILLLFILGLEFNLNRLMRLGSRIALIGLIKFSVITFLGYQATIFLGFGSKVALFVGVLMSFSSTAVITKVLEQKQMYRRKEVPIIIGVLIIEDILAVLALTFFSGMRDTEVSLLVAFEKIVFSIAILVFAYFVMLKLLKYLVRIIMKNNKDESVFTFLSLSLGALFSYFAFFLGLTPSAGAFLAGSLVASLPNSKEYGRAIHPYAMIFTSIFFISMGTLVDFAAVKLNIMLILILVVVLIVSRFIAIGLISYLIGTFRRDAPIFASIATLSMGEFSLLVAKESQTFNLGVDLVSVAASLIFISAILMSFSVNYSEKIYARIKKTVPVKTKVKSDSFSNYIRRFFDQLEIENYSTRRLGYNAKMAFIFLMSGIFTFFLLRRIALILESTSTLMVYLYYIFFASIMLLIMMLAYKKFKIVKYHLSVVLTHVDYSRNMKKCKAILNYLLLAGLTMFAALLFPFAIFALNLSVYYNLISIGLILVFLYLVMQLYYLIVEPKHITPRLKPGYSYARA